VLIILVSVLFCVARNLVPEAAALLAGIETNAVILAVGIFIFIIFRVWAVARAASIGAASR
jgi:hypothetical protein